jgi:flagellar biosynthetic protein FliO
MKHKILKLLILALTLAFTVGAEQSAQGGGTAGVPSMGVAVFRMVGSLALVVAIFFVGAWIFRNMHRFKGAGANHRKLQVLEGKSLGPRQALYVVAYEQQRLLIGSTAQGLTLLTHLPEGEAQTSTSPGTERIVPVSFGEALMQALGRK